MMAGSRGYVFLKACGFCGNIVADRPEDRIILDSDLGQSGASLPTS
jgi:hypothetical protein